LPTSGALLDGLLLSERSLYSSALERLHALLPSLDGPPPPPPEDRNISPTELLYAPSSSTKHLREKRHLLRAVVLQAIGEILSGFSCDRREFDVGFDARAAVTSSKDAVFARSMSNRRLFQPWRRRRQEGNLI